MAMVAGLGHGLGQANASAKYGNILGVNSSYNGVNTHIEVCFLHDSGVISVISAPIVLE